MEFEGAQANRMEANPVAVVEALIHINNQLHQHEVSNLIMWIFVVQILLCVMPQFTYQVNLTIH